MNTPRRKQVIKLSRHAGIFQIYTHLTERERLLLFDLSRGLDQNPVVVEIGSYLGSSTCFLATGARSNNGKVYAVDTWTNLGMSEGSRDTWEEFLCNITHLKKWIVPLRGLSVEVARQFRGQISLLFVDGDHSYEAVQADLQTWLPKVKDHGLVVFHDYNWAEGVRQAVRECVVPLQVEGGHRLDSIYWTRISRDRNGVGRSVVLASVIVPTYRRPAYLRDVLVSLLRQDFPPEQYEIIVVDNKPTGEIREIIEGLKQEWDRHVGYVEESKVGLHNARHAGARAARGEILVYVDDDVIVHPDWLRAILEPFQERLVAVVGGAVLPKWEAEPPDWLSQSMQGYLSLLDLGRNRQELKYPGGVYGCNMAIRRSVLYEVAGFNPDAMGDQRLIWFRGDGESGLHKKVYDAGYKVVYEPRAWVHHRIPPSRLRPDYFCWRAYIQGISDSYTYLRANRLSGAQLLRHAGQCMFGGGRAYARFICGPDWSIRSRIRVSYWYGRAQHQLHAVLSPTLRFHILQDSYL